ncbi:MAG: hypothetical protein OEW27_16265 [Aquincola sp.]|nr:hypothetical protein [Aquincola sp.]MDH5331496.1 hypothetical protein [Aquincola sp.]
MALIAAPEVVGAFVATTDAKGKKAQVLVKVDKPLSKSAAGGKQVEEHTLTITLPPGTYRLQCIQTTVGQMAYGCAPVFADFEVVASRVAYLGHIDVARRERKTDQELRAGSVLPIFDQWYAGYSGGTFDISIHDRFDDDIAVFRKRYAPLASITIEKAVLPPWKPPTGAEADMN